MRFALQARKARALPQRRLTGDRPYLQKLMKTALIYDVSGQDGAYLAQLLLARSYRVFGTARDARAGRHHNLVRLGVSVQVSIESMALSDFRSVLQVLAKVRREEIYNLAGQSSVTLSFEQPVETLESISTSTLDLHEGIRFLSFDPPVQRRLEQVLRQYQRHAGRRTHHCVHAVPTRLPKRAPPTWWPTTARRIACTPALGCCSITSRHFARAASSRARSSRPRTAFMPGRTSRIVGKLDISRDRGWAPDYVEAMWMPLQRETPLAVVIATGRTVSLEYFVKSALECFYLDWRKHVVQDQAPLRQSDISYGAASLRRANAELGWTARHSVDDVVRNMCCTQCEQPAR